MSLTSYRAAPPRVNSVVPVFVVPALGYGVYCGPVALFVFRFGLSAFLRFMCAPAYRPSLVAGCSFATHGQCRLPPLFLRAGSIVRDAQRAVPPVRFWPVVCLLGSGFGSGIVF